MLLFIDIFVQSWINLLNKIDESTLVGMKIKDFDPAYPMHGFSSLILSSVLPQYQKSERQA